MRSERDERLLRHTRTYLGAFPKVSAQAFSRIPKIIFKETEMFSNISPPSDLFFRSDQLGNCAPEGQYGPTVSARNLTEEQKDRNACLWTYNQIFWRPFSIKNLFSTLKKGFSKVTWSASCLTMSLLSDKTRQNATKSGRKGAYRQIVLFRHFLKMLPRFFSC